jgi:hypothetical protein
MGTDAESSAQDIVIAYEWNGNTQEQWDLIE